MPTIVTEEVLSVAQSKPWDSSVIIPMLESIGTERQEIVRQGGPEFTADDPGRLLAAVQAAEKPSDVNWLFGSKQLDLASLRFLVQQREQGTCLSKAIGELEAGCLSAGRYR